MMGPHWHKFAPHVEREREKRARVGDDTDPIHQSSTLFLHSGRSTFYAQHPEILSSALALRIRGSNPVFVSGVRSNWSSTYQLCIPLRRRERL